MQEKDWIQKMTRITSCSKELHRLPYIKQISSGTTTVYGSDVFKWTTVHIAEITYVALDISEKIQKMQLLIIFGAILLASPALALQQSEGIFKFLFST